MSLPGIELPARILITKIGLDGHDRGSRVVAAFLRDAGMEVLYTPPWQEIGQVVRLAEEEDVDVIGISSLATDHLLVPKLLKALVKAGLGHLPVVMGGIVPDADESKLKKAGVRHVFHPGRLARGDRRGHGAAGRASPRRQGEGPSCLRLALAKCAAAGAAEPVGGLKERHGGLAAAARSRCAGVARRGVVLKHGEKF